MREKATREDALAALTELLRAMVSARDAAAVEVVARCTGDIEVTVMPHADRCRRCGKGLQA